MTTLTHFTPLVPSSPFTSRLDRFWYSYSVFLSRQPIPIRNACENLIERRQLHVTRDIPFGLHIADWLCEPFHSALGEHLLDQLTEGYVYLYLYGLLVDDFNDAPDLPDRDALYAATHEHLTKATMLLSSICRRPAMYLKHFEALHTRFRAGDEADMLHYQARDIPDVPTLENYVLKCSLPKACLIVLRDLMDNPRLCDLLEIAYDAAAVGFCLIDDLTDWQDDFVNGRITYPLAKAIADSNKGTSNGHEPDRNQVRMIAEGLYRSGAARDNLMLALPHLEKSYSLFAETGARSWATLMLRTLQSAKHLCGILRNSPPDDFEAVSRIDRVLRGSFARS